MRAIIKKKKFAIDDTYLTCKKNQKQARSKRWMIGAFNKFNPYEKIQTILIEFSNGINPFSWDIIIISSDSVTKKSQKSSNRLPSHKWGAIRNFFNDPSLY